MNTSQKYQRVLVWHRRDLRVKDNPALHHACQDAREVIPVFIFDWAILRSPDIGAPRVAFLLGCLESLSGNIQHLGGRLIIRQGTPVAMLSELIDEVQPQAIFWNEDVEPYSRDRDRQVMDLCLQRGIESKAFWDQTVHHPERVLKSDGTPYMIFTPYSKAWKTMPRALPLPAPLSISTPSSLLSMPIPSLSELGFSLDVPIPEAGERAAGKSLKSFCSNDLRGYASRRDYPAISGTSRLSAHLRFGALSARTVVHAADQALERFPEDAREIQIFINELIWRDFYKMILWHFPHVARSCFRPEFDAIEWENREDYFEAWCQGRTGYDLVDAAMHQLNTTGWMHNRLRMIVASFLTKDLLVDWKWGERYFMTKLYDGDLSANNGGWQWAAGTGTDAQPYFRIFNPMSQAAKFDPEGKFIGSMIKIHERFSSSIQPIVVHSLQRQKALALYKKAKDAMGR